MSDPFVILRFAAGFLALAAGLIILVLGLAAAATLLIAARVEARHPPAVHRIPVPGGSVAYLEDGPRDGPRATIVLLHGASANAHDPMEGVGRHLAAAGFRVVSFDRPGYGGSDRLAGAEAATPAFQARMLADAIDRLGLGPVILMGHSWSGALALRMALDRPKGIAGLVLVAPVAMPFPPMPLPWWADLALKPPVTWLLTHTIAVPLGLYYLPGVARGVFRPEPPVEDYVEKSRAALILRPGSALANIQDLAGLPAALAQQAPLYASLRVPTVIVTGEGDPVVVTAKQAEPLSRAVPGARLVVLPGAGHMITYTAPDALVRETEALLERQ
ncbi:alpha/beta fold hydrolase [Methylorubrum suomiense]|uniref:Cis-3-alkyl-4-alkyloxetan-2-one decarboxylase n=1 Tax=Methylorubrum suomiense TaxID=144191 RepID=A0ABQ4UZA5_9HYPH|nr:MULTISPECIES: alpha/beta hydrolase [Methylobacteriaceae]GJE76012.1 Cis-3-alkyl-4-alkyloxetan-2-one decarboxylase [Methylorubrum suomiense]